MAMKKAKIKWTPFELYRDFGRDNIFLLGTERFIYFPQYNEFIVFKKNDDCWSPTDQVHFDPDLLLRWARSRGHNQLADWIRKVTQ